jgi:hypothetical protein
LRYSPICISSWVLHRQMFVTARAPLEGMSGIGRPKGLSF